MSDEWIKQRSTGGAFIAEIDAADGSRRYSGVERRRANRRVRGDRRQEIRFDLKGGDRRQQPGRRHGDNTASFW